MEESNEKVKSKNKECVDESIDSSSSGTDACGCFEVVDACGCPVIDPCGCYTTYCCC
ncbi:hypothetical protein [Desulfocicer niacini]